MPRRFAPYLRETVASTHAPCRIPRTPAALASRKVDSPEPPLDRRAAPLRSSAAVVSSQLVVDGGSAAVPLTADTCVGNFRIKALIGEGAMGEVYLAQDLVLGRRVALKLIRKAVVEEGGIDRFLEEARATASFNHPHIVTLHAVGEHEGRPFLALEYLDGESLRARCASGPMAPRDALRAVRAIAEAIAEAHAHGIIHADLKPENVVIPRDGRVRVVDFGLARLTGSAGSSGSGTPSYMAPERWTQVAPTPAIDVWALGILLYELVSGARPFSDMELAQLAFSSADPRLPVVEDAGANAGATSAADGTKTSSDAGASADSEEDSWRALARECLRRAPDRRPVAEEVVRRLGDLLDRPLGHEASARGRAGGGAARVLGSSSDEGSGDSANDETAKDRLRRILASEPRNPYPGLAAFSRSDSSHYAGRGAEVDAAVEALRTRALLPIVGPSGVGKSSFVSAALIPRLEESGAWDVVSCRPGAAPLLSLATALGDPELASKLAAHPARLVLALSERSRARGVRPLLFLDQFEECFTLAPAEARAFCACLATAALPDEPWRIVLTVRDDFLIRLAEAPEMRPHLGALQVLGPMTFDDLCEAIRRPLRNAGYTSDTEALPARIVEDVRDQPASLSLLQFTCHALWERRDQPGRRLLTSKYEAMGGASGALASHAERVLAELTPAQVRQVRSLFLMLVEPDGTRHPRLRSELVDDRDDIDKLLELLLERRLVVVARQLDDDQPQLELAHEALTKAWPRLARWLDETHEQRLLVVEVEQAASLWDKRGQRDDETWTGVALGEALRKVEAWSIDLPTKSRRFLEAGEERARKSRRRRRWIVGTAGMVLIAGAIVATGAAIAFARSERRTREQQVEIKLAAADMGVFELRLIPYDWNRDLERAETPPSMPVLTWRLRAPSADDPLEPGRELTDGIEVIRGTPNRRGPIIFEQVQARSGRVFLEVNRGQSCAPSVILLQRLPGYTERKQRTEVQINVPTCEASNSTSVEIPAGPFIQNTDSEEGRSYDAQLELAAFAIDRNEVTRAAYGMYDDMKALTGDETAPTDFLDATVPARNTLPVVGINYFTARRYCRFMGKDLPTIQQWQKAFRGGLFVDRLPNPNPYRRTVWLEGRKDLLRPANLSRGDYLADLAPIGGFPLDRSPYGILDLAGNVSEWTLSMAVAKHYRGLRIVAGGNWGGDFNHRHEEISWKNSRPSLSVDFAIGARCVSLH